MSAISDALLRWYDGNARDLPWRVSPAARESGATPDPYRVWLSEIMLQQTTVATVRRRFEEFIARWPTVDALAKASLDEVLGEWAGLGYYARARNLHGCAVAVAARGRFPDTEEELRTLPGIGAYTAAAIAAIAFDRRAIVVDGNIERVAARLFAIETPFPGAKTQLRERLDAIWPKNRSGDFAQGLMDLGAMTCTPRAPDCLFCPLESWCVAGAKGIAADLPRKTKKIEKPTRRGIAYALVNSRGQMLFERRPEKGLLGGMLGLPCTEWTAHASPCPASGIGAPLRAPVSVKWKSAGTVRHSFTHFRLELDVMVASVPPADHQKFERGLVWLAPRELRLPTVMRKAVDLALA